MGDFDANPILQCIEIDGITGSNLIRHCNWTINQEHNYLSLSNNTELKTIEDAVVIPFNSDNQYNIFIDVSIGKAKNFLVDYGFNGSIAVNKEIFTVLNERKIINKTQNTFDCNWIN